MTLSKSDMEDHQENHRIFQRELIAQSKQPDTKESNFDWDADRNTVDFESDLYQTPLRQIRFNSSVVTPPSAPKRKRRQEIIELNYEAIRRKFNFEVESYQTQDQSFDVSNTEVKPVLRLQQLEINDINSKLKREYNLSDVDQRIGFQYKKSLMVPQLKSRESSQYYRSSNTGSFRLQPRTRSNNFLCHHFRQPKFANSPTM